MSGKINCWELFMRGLRCNAIWKAKKQQQHEQDESVGRSNVVLGRAWRPTATLRRLPGPAAPHRGASVNYAGSDVTSQPESLLDLHQATQCSSLK